MAQAALGHNSKAMAQYYSKGAELVLPSLETWKAEPNKIVSVEFKSVSEKEPTVAAIASLS